MDLIEKDTQAHPSGEELQAALDWIRQSPRDLGRLEMIAARPQNGQRTLLDEASLSLESGLIGDNWLTRGQANPDAQITLMNARVIQTAAKTKERWALAGDQLFVDLDLSQQNLAPGDRLLIGSAVLEITALPHTGCAQFTARFGHAAIQWVNSPEGRALRLRGVNARVLHPGAIRVGDTIVIQHKP